jgi:hypothetical protein
MVSLRIQEDLRSLPVERAPWRVSSPLSPEAKQLLGTFARLELQKENPTGDRTQLSYDLAGLRQAAWRIAKPKLGQIFSVFANSPGQKSPVRSYKGLFWGTPVKKEDFRQREIDMGEQSYFLGVAKVNPTNNSWAFGKALQRFCSFLYVTSGQDIDTVAEKVLPVLPEFINRDIIPHFELPRLVPALLADDEAIFYLDIDFHLFSERWSELSIYTKTANIPYWKQALNAQMEDAEWSSLFELRAPEEQATKTSRANGSSNYGRVSWPGKQRGGDRGT